MSKLNKKNKKSKKNRNNYKIESLEPRLLMDATLADDWIEEADSSVNQFGDYNISASDSKMEGLLVYENGTGSEPEALSLADVVSGQKIQYKQDVKSVKKYVCGVVDDLRDEGTKTQKLDRDNKKTHWDDLKELLDNADPNDEGYADLVDAVNDAETEYHAAEAAYDKAYKEFRVDADALVQRLMSDTRRHSEWTFAVDTTDPNQHKVSVQIKKKTSLSYSTNKQIAADIAEQTQIGVLFETFDFKSNASGYTTVSFTLDGDKNTGFDDNASVDVRFDFKQDLGNTDANIGILGLESRNDGGAVSLPDLTVIGSFQTDSKNNSTIATNYEYDLDFRVKNYASVATLMTNFAVDDTDHLKYIGNTAVGQAPVWQDAAGSAVNDENALIPDFANVRIGDVLKQFNAIAKWLQNAETEILKNDFEGLIDQNASSFLYLSNYFATFVKTPPQSFQELLSRFDYPVITAEFKNVSGKNICQLKYDGWITSQNLEASVSEALFKSLSNSFGGIEKVSLSLGAQSHLKMTFDIPMDELGSVGNSAKLKSIGVDAEKVAGLVGAKNVCVADKALSKTSSVGEEIKFALYENGSLKKDITIPSTTSLDEAGIQSIVGELNKAYPATGAGTSPKFGVIINKDGNGDVDKFAIVTDDTANTFSLLFASDNSRKMCVNSSQQFCKAYLIDTTMITSLSVDNKTVQPKETGIYFDWAAAINEVLMSNPNLTDYSAVSLGDAVIVFYSQSEQNVLVTGENSTSAPTDVWLPFSGSAGVERQILFSSSHPVETSNSDLSFAFAINGGAAQNILLEAETLANCYTVDDVVSVINGELTKLGNGIKAFAWEGKIGFSNENDLPFGVSLSNKDLGFDNLAYSSTTNCMKMKFDVGGPTDIEVDIDLYNFFKTKSDPTIGNLLDEIKTQCNNILSTKAPSCSVDVNGMSLVVSGGKFSSSGAVEDLNGCSLVELLGWNVDNDSDSFLVVHAQSQKEITISNFSLDIYETLTSNGNIASARLGMVGVDVTGNVGIRATRKLTANNLIGDVTEIPLDTADTDFTSNFTLGNWSYASTSTNTLNVDLSEGLLVDDATQNAVKQHVMSADLYATVVGRALIPDPSYISKTENSSVASLKLINMSALVEKVTKALKENVLKSILAYGESATPSTDPILAVLNQKLPLFGKSAPELLGLINKLNDVIDNISKSHPATLQELNQRVDKALGAKLYFTFHASSIDFSFVWKQEYKSQVVSINNFSIMETAEGARPTNVGGLAEVYLNGSIDTRFNYSMSVNGSALGDPILQEDSSVSIDVTLMGKPLSFDLSVALGGMSASLLKVVSSDSNPSYIAVRIHEKMAYRNTATSGSAAAGSFSSYEWKHDADVCQIGGLLRVECAGQSVGEIKLGVVDDEGDVDAWKGDAGNNGSFALNDLVSGKVGIRKPGKFTGTLSAAELGDNTTGSIVLDMSNLGSNWEKIDLFGQVRLVADALSAALRKAQSGLNKTFLSDGMRKIPLVGNTIVGAADCLTALDEAFIEPFRKFAYNSQNLDEHVVAERLYAILQRTGLLLALKKEVSSTQKVMWAGSAFDQSFEDNGSQYIQYRNDGNCIEWRFRLGQSYSLSGNADFDLGMPGLGLSSKGGVDLELGWEWYIGFGVSQTGAYIMLSNGIDEDGSETVNGKTVNIVADGISKKVETVVNGTTVKQDLMSGDDICITMRVLANELKINGALGFLQMSADVLPGGTNPFEKDAETGKDKLSEITFGIDLNDGQRDSKDADSDKTTDSSVDTKIKADNVASALSLETNLEGSLDIKVDMTLGFNNDKIDIGFPTIGTVFHLTWEAVFGKPFGELTLAEFSGITLDLGKFAKQTLQPILSKIQKVIDPIMPLIDFLQSEIPVLSSLPKGGSKMTVLNLIKSIGSSQGLELGMIDDIVQVANLIKKVGNLNLGAISLGSLNFASTTYNDPKVQNFLAGTAELPLGDFTSRLSGITDSALKTATSSLSSAFGSQRVAANGNSYGWRFGLFQDAKGNISADAIKKSAINLLFGQDVSLVEYRMSPLIFDFDWSKSFPIVGPLCADIGLNFGAKIELSFGYDTRGLISWKKTGFKDLWALADGFFIDDLDSNGKDVSEVIFYSGITAGASVAGRAGINVGVNLNLNLNLDDPNNDGKLRLSELADSLAHSPFAIFDASVTLQARAYAYLDLVFYRKEFDLWKSGALELFNTDKTGTGSPIVATTQEGNLVVNVGEFAEKRVYGDLSDGDDTVDIVCSGGTVDITMTTADKVSTKSSYTLAAGKCVYIYAKDGKDKVSITGNSSLNFVIEGGDGNDEIDLSGLNLAPTCYALVMGGLGDDFIRGADIGTNILLGETADVLYKKKESSDEEYVALVNAYPNSSNPGNNVIVGGRGKNYIVGGGGSDLIVGGVDAKFDNKDADGNVTGTLYVTENHLYGDFAYFEFDESHNLTNAKNEDLYDEGGNDVILGSSKTDFIFGGAGSDRIKGGDGNDEIHGGKGNDVIYGGAGNDKIYGEDGVDVIFGDTPADEAMVIAREDDAVGELPYVYIAEEIKKDTSDLFGSDTVTTTDADGNVSSESVNRIALFNFENSFKTDVASLNALAQVAVSLFDAPQVDLSATQTAATTGATTTGTTAATEAEGTEPQAEEEPSTQVTNGSDVIEGGNGSDIIFGDDGSNTSEGGSDIISGGADNDFIDGDGGNDTINGDYGEDIIYGGAGNDTLDGGAGNDFVFGDNGLAGYVKDNNGAIIGASELFKNSFSGSDDDKIAKANQDLMFGYGITAFAKNFGITADAKFNGVGGNDTILAGNGNDFVDGQGGDDTYKIQIMGGSNHAITNVMDSGTADKGDSMTIDGTVEADDMLVRASTAGLGFVAKLPSKKDAQIERVNFWNVGGGDTGLENIAINTGAGDDKIAIDGTLSTISIDAGAGNDTITVGQQFESERNTDKDHSNVLPNDAFTTTKTTQGYLSAGVQHSTSIVGGEGNDTFNVLHNEAAVSLSGGLGNDTFNVAMFQKVNNDGSKSIVENGPVTLIGGAGVDKMSIVGSDGDDDFVISQGRVLCNGTDVQAVSIENKNVYGGDGDDSFYVLDTAKDEVTKLYGNKGNDSFYNGGIGTAEKPVIVSNSKNENSDAIGVQFDVPKNNTVGDADPANGVIDYDTDLDCAKNYIVENGVVKSVYKIHLDKEPEKGEVVSVTVFAPGETTESLNRGDHGIWLVDANNKYVKSITYKFTIDGAGETHKYDEAVDINLVVLGDKVREGNDYFALMHKVTSSKSDRLIKDCKNALIFLNENAAQQSFLIKQVHEVKDAEFTAEKFTLLLNETPNGNTVECFYYANGQKIPLGSANVVENNGKFQVTVDVPASVKTAMDAAKTPYVYVGYNIDRPVNKVENQFSITQEHVLTAEEVTRNKVVWGLRALPNKQNIDCWYMNDGEYVSIPASNLNKLSFGGVTYENTLSVSGVSSIPAGTKLYINYRFDHVYVENESVLQMAYSTTGMTELLCFVPFDEITDAYDDSRYSIVCPESKVADYKDVENCRYFYRTAGTQLIICAMPQDGVDTSSAKPVVLHGNFAIEWSADDWHRPAVAISDEPDSFNETSVTEILDALDDDTIENIKGALYEDGMGREADLGIDGPSMLHYDGLDADGNRLTTSNDEKNVISESDLAERKAAEEEAAKFDEGNSKDRIFVNNRKNNRAGIKNDIDALSEIAKFDNSMIEKDVDPALILQKTEDVVKQADTEWRDSDEHSLRFEHQDASSTATSQFNLANMEYGEINLGSGADKVDINKTIYREDGFQTFTVVNTGAGKDNINVHSYAREKSTVLGTLSGLTKTTYSGSLKNVIAYSVSDFTFSNGVTSDNLKAIVAQNNDKLDRGLLAQNRVFLNVEYSDGTIQRREVFLEDNDETTVTTLLLKRELTPVAQDVSIVAMYLANGYDGDGLLVVNAQGGDDTINAVGDVDADGKSKVTREGMVVIGGVGNDTIDVNTNVIAIGDRGQIVYENEKSEIVTRLGSLDIENSETDDAKLNAADYTTPADKTASNYFQTDGVVRDAKYIHSVSETVGGNDVITAHGDKNVAIGGAGSDEIYLNGENNVAVGDNGEVKFAGSDVVKNASGDVVDHVYGDSSTTYLNYVQSTSDAHGAIDTITTQNGKNVVIGGTDSDMIATGSGNDVIVGDGGEVYVDRNRDALLVDNVGRNVDGSAGSDVIKTSGGDNVILSGLNTKSRDFDFVRNAESGKLDKMSIDKKNDDLIESGDGKDVVFGDNAYVTFKGNSEMAEGFDNMPTIYTEATLSFNFQGPAQSGIGANEQAGAVADYRAKSVDETTGETVEITEHADYCVGNWNNIKSVYGRESGTYGNDDNEIVLFDNGTRASAVSVTYGATESHRISTTDGENIRLRGYDQTPYVHGSNSGDVNLMKSGLDISGNNGRNTLITQVDGLSQYFTEYEVVVYLDMVREISMHENSVRVVKLYIDSVDENGKLTSTFFDEFYVNDPDTQTFNGTWNVATGKSVATATLANCVVFKSFVENDTKHTLAGDRFHIEITDPQNGTNGKDRAGIAGIQVHGFMHKQDVAASTDIDMGGKDVILTNGGDDIVVGGTGNDTITTFGDDRYGIRDNDIVYGDNAKMVFTDRDSDPTTATTISHAESIATTNLKASYDDIINTGDGNDVVVGGVGHDVVNSNATSGAEAKMDNIQVTSFNFVTETTSDSLLIHAGESAGVVVDNDWHNVYLRNNQMRDRATGNESAPSTVITFEYTSIGNYGNRNNPNEQIDPATGDDTANNKMLKTLVMGQRQETLSLTLHNLPGPSGSPCDVYVYVGGKLGSSDGYDYVFEINGSDNQKFYLNDWIGNSFEGEYKEVTCKDYKPGKLASGVTPNVEMIGNYVVFRNVKTCDYTVQIRCVESTLGNQYPNDIPVFSGVQVVSGLNRTGDIALGGDHDKDLVFGDEASLDFDLDIPFAGNENIKDYKNRVISAESMALATEAVQHLRTDDEIKTGKDRDVVVGGEGRDTISTGSGDDVAIGDNAKLMVENNNPIGVFQPDVEVVLEDNQYFDGYKEAYLDNDQVNEQRMMQKFYEGKIVGIQLQDSENGRLDSIDVGAGENLVFEQSRSEEQLFVGTLESDEDEDDVNPSDIGGEGSEGTEGEGSESGEGSEGTEQIAMKQFVLSQKHVPVYVEIAAGETVEIVITDWEEGNPYYRPKVVLEMNSLDNMMHYLDISWDGISEAITRDLLNYNWLEIPNSSTVPGEHKIVLQIHSDEAIAFLASCGN
ncbi:calcium-binding protein [Fibrobacter sp. UWH3]|uniref:calcium-binding protein n=1 Tax=Fibrobacter sp. UWH3 TaxID=1964353 RepID=UPI000B742309|nr:calcium-binding protein [Fibrobacter sp. UWH3]OWV08321.1 hypothetical protein B7993_01460 [Fibrobacter sp. UWH3]